jgi:Holliday junction resolvasome RuvABC endonuclease subunit
MAKEFGNKDFKSNTPAIGIDQSLTGFALCFIDTQNPDSYYVQVYKSPYSGVQRLDDIRKWMIDSIDNYIPTWKHVDIAMEGTVLASHSALVLGELSGMVKLALFQEYGSLPLQVPPMTLKKYATGKGTSKKQEMLMQIYKRWGAEFNDDNAADAYALARIAAKTSIDAVELAVIEQLKDLKYRDQITA